MRSVRFHEAAIAEIVHETLYYRNVSKALGARFALAVEQATQLASEFPDMGSPYKYGTRRVFPRKFGIMEQPPQPPGGRPGADDFFGRRIL